MLKLFQTKINDNLLNDTPTSSSSICTESNRLNFHTKCISFVEGVFVMIVNSVDSDKMPQYAAFHLGLHCLSKNEFKRVYKVFSDMVCLIRFFTSHQQYFS